MVLSTTAGSFHRCYSCTRQHNELLKSKWHSNSNCSKSGQKAYRKKCNEHLLTTKTYFGKMFLVLLCFHTILASNSHAKQNFALSQDWKIVPGKMKEHFWFSQPLN